MFIMCRSLLLNKTPLYCLDLSPHHHPVTFSSSSQLFLQPKFLTNENKDYAHTIHDCCYTA